MNKKSSAYGKLLMATFSAQEVAYLKQQARFRLAMACVRSFNDFERLCSICRRLLARRLADPIAT